MEKWARRSTTSWLARFENLGKYRRGISPALYKYAQGEMNMKDDPKGFWLDLPTRSTYPDMGDDMVAEIEFCQQKIESCLLDPGITKREIRKSQQRLSRLRGFVSRFGRKP